MVTKPAHHSIPSLDRKTSRVPKCCQNFSPSDVHGPMRRPHRYMLCSHRTTHDRKRATDGLGWDVIVLVVGPPVARGASVANCQSPFARSQLGTGTTRHERLSFALRSRIALRVAGRSRPDHRGLSCHDPSLSVLPLREACSRGQGSHREVWL